MIPLDTVFVGLVLLFGLVGALRGWAKEIIVAFSVLLSLFTQQVLGQLILGPDNPYLPVLLEAPGQVSAPEQYTPTQFYASTGLLLVLTFFGYAGPTLVSPAGAKVAREALQDALLGLFLGLINGYLVFGTLWFYVSKSGYMIGGIDPPSRTSAAWAIVHTYLAPVLLTTPMLYLAIALAFVFVIVVFV